MLSLSKKYPEFFAYFKSEISVQDLSIREGWYDLIDKYLGLMYNHCQETGNYIKITDIKEKFGGLDINFHDGDDVTFQLMIEVNRESRHICEFCSYPDAKQTTMKEEGWVYTICDKCYENKIHKRL